MRIFQDFITSVTLLLDQPLTMLYWLQMKWVKTKTNFWPLYFYRLIDINTSAFVVSVWLILKVQPI